MPLFVQRYCKSDWSLIVMGSCKLIDLTSSFLGDCKAMVRACKQTKSDRGNKELLVKTSNLALAKKMKKGDMGHNDKRVIRLWV